MITGEYEIGKSKNLLHGSIEQGQVIARMKSFTELKLL